MSIYSLRNTNSDGSGAWTIGIGAAPLPTYTVATLPSAASSSGVIAIVTDATLTAITGLGLAPVGNSSNIVKVWSNGTIWIIG